jgi:type I restriction enzyme S subunit
MSTLKELLKDVPVEWKALGAVTNVLRGRRLTKNQLNTEGYPVFHGGLDPLGYYQDFNRKANTVMIINVGASAGNVGYCANDFWSSDGCYCLEQVEIIYSKYLYYFLLAHEYFIKSKVRFAGIPTLDAAIIEKIQIPIPYPNNPEKSLEIQQEIVRVLDGLSEQNKALTSALGSGMENFGGEYFKNKQY